MTFDFWYGKYIRDHGYNPSGGECYNAGATAERERIFEIVGDAYSKGDCTDPVLKLIMHLICNPKEEPPRPETKQVIPSSLTNP